MRYMIAAVSLMMLWSTVAEAQQKAYINNPKYHKTTLVKESTLPAVSRNLLDAMDANSDAAARTVTVEVTGYSKTTISVQLTRGGDAGFVYTTCSGSLDDGATYGSVQARSIAGSTGTLSDYVDTKVVTASKNIVIDYSVSTYTHFSCVFSTDTANALDSLTVQMTSEVGR